MSKKLDWDSMYKAPMRGKVTSLGAGYSSRKEQVQQSYDQLKKSEVAQEKFQKIEPFLKKSLLEHLLERRPITVERPMTYLTEALEKSEDEVDRAYYNNSGSEKIPTFQIINKAIEPGTVLTFKHFNTALKQLIFKSSTGEEIEIYQGPYVHVPGVGGTKSIQNPGYWGLLMATNIYREVLEELEGDQE